MDAYNIIIKPVLTEKSYKDVANKKYVFVVDMKATKVDIKNAIKKVFGVNVERVNTLIVKPKIKTQNTKKKRTVGKTSAYKKAFVTLTEDSKPIEFFESLN